MKEWGDNGNKHPSFFSSTWISGKQKPEYSAEISHTRKCICAQEGNKHNKHNQTINIMVEPRSQTHTHAHSLLVSHYPSELFNYANGHPKNDFNALKMHGDDRFV